MAVRKLSIDVMVGDRFYCTLRMPITFETIVDYTPEGVILNYKKVKEFVEEKLPTIKNKDYQIYV